MQNKTPFITPFQSVYRKFQGKSQSEEHRFSSTQQQQRPLLSSIEQIKQSTQSSNCQSINMLSNSKSQQKRIVNQLGVPIATLKQFSKQELPIIQRDKSISSSRINKESKTSNGFYSQRTSTGREFLRTKSFKSIDFQSPNTKIIFESNKKEELQMIYTIKIENNQDNNQVSCNQKNITFQKNEFSKLPEQNNKKYQTLQENLNNFIQQQQQISPSGFPLNQGMKQAFGYPTSRQEIEILSNWLDLHIGYNENIDENNDQDISLEIILLFTLKELIRQVSVQCQDRGYLIQKVVNLLIEQKQSQIDKEVKLRNQQKLQALQKIMFTREDLQIQIKELNKNEIENEKSLQTLNEKYIILSERYEKLKEFNQNLKNKKKEQKLMLNILIDNMLISKQWNANQQTFPASKLLSDDEDSESKFSDNLTQSKFNKIQNTYSETPISRASSFQKKIEVKNFSQLLRKKITQQITKELEKRISYRSNKQLKQPFKIRSQKSAIGIFKQDTTSSQRSAEPRKTSNFGQINIDQQLKDEENKLNFLLGQQQQKTKIQNLHNEDDHYQNELDIQNIQNLHENNNNSEFTPIIQYYNTQSKQPKTAIKIQQKINQGLQSQQELEIPKIQKFKSFNSSQSSSSFDENTIGYENKSMQFPEDDILTEHDFKINEENIQTVNVKGKKKAKVIISNKDKSNKHEKIKYSKHIQEEELNVQEKEIRLELNLSQLKQPSEESKLDIFSGDSMDSFRSNKQEHQMQNNEQLKQYLEDEFDQIQFKYDDEVYNILDEFDEHKDNQYVEINENNKIFYNESILQGHQIQQQTENDQINFPDKVNIIVNMILENVNQKQLSKKQFCQLIISNILKNEQDEIQSIIMQQLFNKQGGLNQQKEKVNNKDIGQSLLPSYLLQKNQDQGIQTDAVLMIDFLDCGVNPAEVFKFDRKSQKLFKYVFERNEDQDIVKQFVYANKYGNIDQYYQIEEQKTKNSEVGQKKLIGHAKSIKFEIDRNNKVLSELLSKIRELEEYVACLVKRKEELEEILDKNFQVKDRFVQRFDLFVNSWHRGFVIGFERGMSSGYFKGAVENRNYGVQEGFQIGLKEGWQFGFDDGFKQGIRKIYKEAKDKNLDVNLLTPALHLYLSISEKRQGIQAALLHKMFKITSFKVIGPIARKYIDKFKSSNEKKKKQYAKLGIKSIIKLIRQMYTNKIVDKEHFMSEFVYEQMQKKCGHNKIADKYYIQLISSAFYHCKQHPKIDLFCSFMHLSEKPYSNDVLNFYLKILDSLQNSKIGLKNEYDDKIDRELINLAKAIEVMREQLETMLPIEVILELRKSIEKLKVKSVKGNQLFIDFDKYMDFMVRSYIKFSVDLLNKPQMLYFAWTLFEQNSLSMTEIQLTLEILAGQKVMMLSDEKEKIEILQKDILSIFQEQCIEGDIVVIRYVHFHSIIKDSDIFHSKASNQLFNKLPYRGNIRKFQDMFDDQSKKLKSAIYDIYSDEEVCERMEKLDTKEQWFHRIYAIERNIGEVNSTLLYLSLLLIKESLVYMKSLKDQIVRIIWEERHGKKAPQNVNADQLQKDGSQFKEQSIKLNIQSKVNEVALNATPNFISRKESLDHIIEETDIKQNTQNPQIKVEQLEQTKIKQ